jgi:predicted patatin/cPLA2 family phospholipase
MKQTGLVLEGGGMRGVYTAGVLEFFMDQNLFFPYVIGVSAGACQAASYLSRQRGRNRDVNIGFVKDPRYISWKNYWKNRELFGMDFVFEEIPLKHIPFDFETFLNKKERLVVGTTDCMTGHPVYHEEYDRDILQIIRASSSLPFIAPIVDYKGKKLLDGGISDPIPIKKAQQDGMVQNVVVLTRNAGYEKKKSNMLWMAKRSYRSYPGLIEALEHRYQIYNETIAYVEKEAEKGSVFIIRPEEPLSVGRMERNPVKLEQLYQQGYEEAKSHYDELIKWLG